MAQLVEGLSCDHEDLSFPRENQTWQQVPIISFLGRERQGARSLRLAGQLVSPNQRAQVSVKDPVSNNKGEGLERWFSS